MARKTPRRSYHHGDLRTALLTAAATIVRRDGAAGFSLREAAREVGVDPAACYRHFRDRQTVLLALAQQGFERLAAAMAAASDDVGDPLAALLRIGRVYVGFAREHPADFRIMFGDSGTTAQDPRLRLPTVPRTAYEQLELLVGAWSRAAAVDVDVTHVARALWSAVHGVARLVLDGALVLTDAEADALTTDLVTAVLRGLAHPAVAPTRLKKPRAR